MKVSVVGIGRVGSVVAYTTLLRGLADELVLVNRNHDRALGEAADLQHASAFSAHPVEVRAGSIADTRGSQAVVVCLSAPVPPDIQSRLELGRANAALFDTWIPKLTAHNPEAVFVIVTNPVDVMTHRALALSQLPPSQVVGTGTLIDSARFRALLSAEAHIHADDIRAYVLGEHGDSQLPALSAALAGGEPVDPQLAQRLFERTVRSGYDVVRSKGYTSFAISQAVATVLDAIASDAHRTMPLSVRVDGYAGVRDVCLSLPVVMGRRGVVRQLQPMLSTAEAEALRASAAVVREAIEAVGSPPTPA